MASKWLRESSGEPTAWTTALLPERGQAGHGRVEGEAVVQAAAALGVTGARGPDGQGRTPVVVGALLVGDDRREAVHAPALEDTDQHIAAGCGGRGRTEGEAGHPGRQGAGRGGQAAAEQAAPGEAVVHDRDS
jgi:hypothetical protein